MTNKRNKLSLILGVGLAGAMSIAAAPPATGIPGSTSGIRLAEPLRLPGPALNVKVVKSKDTRLTKNANRFRKIDLDKDGVITRAEAKQAKKKGLYKRFKKYDLNDDGKLTMTEMTKVRKDRKKFRKNPSFDKKVCTKRHDKKMKKAKLDRRGKEKRDRNVKLRRGARAS